MKVTVTKNLELDFQGRKVMFFEPEEIGRTYEVKSEDTDSYLGTYGEELMYLPKECCEVIEK